MKGNNTTPPIHVGLAQHPYNTGRGRDFSHFDGLMETQNELFLDIACFFKGENKDCIREILRSFGYYPDYNIGVLMDKSLITINENGALWMHDLLQEMGQHIVRRGSFFFYI